MNDDILRPNFSAPPSHKQPLYGVTVLVVDDSRLAAESIRLMCLRSGARIRRADCLRSAQRHLQTYRPNVVIVDMGLPDGSGADLIQMICSITQDAPPIIAISGDPDLADEAFAAGADDFLAKPLHSLAAFQRSVLSVLQNPEPRVLSDDRITPDPMAFMDDLSHAAGLLARGSNGLTYAAGFLASLARDAHDEALEQIAQDLSHDISTLPRARGLVADRLSAAKAI